MPRQASYTYRGPPILTMEPFTSTVATCLLYLKKEPHLPKRAASSAHRRASFNHRGVSYIYEQRDILYLQSASYAHRESAVLAEGLFRLQGPPVPTELSVPTESFLYLQRGLLYPDGTRVSIEGPPYSSGLR